MPVGILGLGVHLPPDVRRNDWWSPETVASWSERVGHRATSGDGVETRDLPEGVRRTLAAMNEYARDPFRGAVERRVMAPETTVSEMEASAAREAMARARVGVGEIDVVLSQTPVPEHLMVNSACVTHRLLGLPRRCFVMGTEGACNGFALHASLAQAMIESGQARHVLSLHSSAITRVHGPAEPQSAWWGDGAAAVVFGPVSEGRGLLAAIHNADGSSCEALVLGVPDHPWWSDGAITTHTVDRTHTRTMLMTLADRAREAIAASLEAASLAPAQVDFYASHQGTAWFTRVTAEHSGISHARSLATFPSVGNMNSVNVPYILATAERKGLLPEGSNVVTFSGGLGETWSSLVLRWGR